MLRPLKATVVLWDANISQYENMSKDEYGSLECTEKFSSDELPCDSGQSVMKWIARCDTGLPDGRMGGTLD